VVGAQLSLSVNDRGKFGYPLQVVQEKRTLCRCPPWLEQVKGLWLCTGRAKGYNDSLKLEGFGSS
jgi:hypothetical protein